MRSWRREAASSVCATWTEVRRSSPSPPAGPWQRRSVSRRPPPPGPSSCGAAATLGSCRRVRAEDQGAAWPFPGKEVRSSPFLQAGVSCGVVHGDGQDGGDDAAADGGVQGQSHCERQLSAKTVRLHLAPLYTQLQQLLFVWSSTTIQHSWIWDSRPARVVWWMEKTKVSYLW